MEYYTALVNNGNKQEPIDTFKAKDFNHAIEIVHSKYPDKPYRLYKGDCVPEKNVEQKLPPKIPAKAK